MATFAVILPAAGKSSRFKDKHYKKVYASLDNRAVWLHSAEKFVNRDDVKQVILVIAPEDREEFTRRFAANTQILGIKAVEGGTGRAESVEAGLAHVKPDIDFVCVHDAARPCLATEWIDKIFQAGQNSGAAILAIPLRGTLKRVGSDHTITETISRENMWEAQTPQVFRRDWLLEAYSKREGFVATDDAQLVECLGHKVTVVPGSPINLKIATQEDLRLAAQAIKALPKPRLDRPAHPFADDNMWR